MKVNGELNLNKVASVTNEKIDVQSSNPSSGNVAGRVVYNSTEKVWYGYDGTTWQKLYTK